MRLSELTTDQALDVLCEIAPAFISIVSDESLMDELKRKTDLKEGATRAEYLASGAKKITALVPIILKGHRDDVYAILAAVNNKNPDDIASQPVFTTVNMVKDLVQDKDLMDFFGSFSPKD